MQDSLEAHALLRRDVDYLVKAGSIEMVDEFKGRIALNRRWPAGLQTAVEAKEGVVPKSQGMVLGSTTIQHLVALYPRVCGMTGTAATQALEFQTVYGLRVETIPTSRQRNPARPCNRPTRSCGNSERRGIRKAERNVGGRATQRAERPQ